MDHDEIYEDTWEDDEDEWLLYFKNDVLSTAFCYARFLKDVKETTGFWMKNCLTLLSLPNRFFDSLGDENDEPINTYNEVYMGWFVRQSIKGGRSAALNQHYKSINQMKRLIIFHKI